MLRKLGAIINNQFINPLCATKNSENKFYHFLDNIHIGLETVEFV